VRSVRESFRWRYLDNLRVLALDQGGGDARSEAKARWASDGVANLLQRTLDGSSAMAPADLPAVALGLRALLASGSSTRFGPHADIALRTLDWLEQRLPELSGAPLAATLAAYVDGAMVTGGVRLDLAVVHAARLVDEILLLPSDGDANQRLAGRFVASDRLCDWTTPSSALADAAVVLSYASGLGLSAAKVANATEVLRSTLEERIERGGDRAISARVAILHAFGGQQQPREREQLLNELTYQRAYPQWLAGDLPALQQLTWSLYRTATDWGRFNRRMRSFALGHKPRDLREHAALTLMLAVYYAAPGVEPRLAL
jgi:hypothetical protein